MKCNVRLVRDNETGWWYTESDSMPGMVFLSSLLAFIMKN